VVKKENIFYRDRTGGQGVIEEEIKWR